MRRLSIAVVLALVVVSITVAAVMGRGSIAAGEDQSMGVEEASPITLARTVPVPTGNTSLPQAGPGLGPHVLARAAEILGVDLYQLTSAIEQAEGEIRRERVDHEIAKRLAFVVEAEGATQQQVDEILAWWHSRPAFVDPGLLGHAYRRHLGPGLVLSPLVQHGRLTQLEADAVDTWWGARPLSLEPSLVMHWPSRAKDQHQPRQWHVP